MSLKDINLNTYFGDNITIDNATHITIEHDKAITNNPEYQNSDCDTVNITIHCSDMPSRHKGLEDYKEFKKCISLTPLKSSSKDFGLTVPSSSATTNNFL